MYANSAADKVLRHYKFVLVFENANAKDYVTEKLWRAFRMGVVPVYMGAPNVLRDFAPTPQAAVLTSAFATPGDLARHLLHLATNQTAYDALLSYKWDASAIQRSFVDNWMTARPSWQCRVCEFVASNRSRSFQRDDATELRVGVF